MPKPTATTPRPGGDGHPVEHLVTAVGWCQSCGRYVPERDLLDVLRERAEAGDAATRFLLACERETRDAARNFARGFLETEAAAILRMLADEPWSAHERARAFLARLDELAA